MKKLTIILILFSTFLFSQQSIFWKISKDDSESYILGTYHYLGKDFINENKIILEKLKQSKIALSENIDSANIFINKRDENLILKKLDKNEIETIKNIVPNYVDAKKMTLRELIITIDGKISSKFCLTEKEKSDNIKMDDYLKKYSLENNLKLVGLEPTKNTFDYINNSLYLGATDEKLLQILKTKIILLNSEKQNLNCSIINEYRTKKHLFNFTKERQEKLITARNKDWIDKIDNAIKQNKKVFIFVGLFHLDFKDGLLELLKKRDYKIEEIELK
ncbi:TraB/GumN family protein [Cloacibacterium caeni]|jgi:uncharacterized protein YbaP (TraB family)|uniref:TraB/GumN family protein n=1 Tax=Cloacibacterium caeni TaxID=2004710 RepID=UPI001BD12099|nr:TraB/GumN family protein [Cloacibacterium caeni]